MAKKKKKDSKAKAATGDTGKKASSAPEPLVTATDEPPAEGVVNHEENTADAAPALSPAEASDSPGNVLQNEC